MTLYIFFENVSPQKAGALLGAGHSVLQLFKNGVLGQKADDPVYDSSDIVLVGKNDAERLAKTGKCHYISLEELDVIIEAIQATNAKQQRSQVMYLNAQARKELLPYKRGYLCTCKDCDVKELQSTSNGAINFIGRHAGHNTWVETEHRWTDNKTDARKQAEDAMKKLADRKKGS